MAQYSQRTQPMHRRNKWLELINREDLKDAVNSKFTVCEKHFCPEDIIESLFRKILKKNALPLNYLLQKEDKVHDEEESHSTETGFVSETQVKNNTSEQSPSLLQSHKWSQAIQNVLSNEKNKKQYLFESYYRFLPKTLADLCKTGTHLKMFTEDIASREEYSKFFYNLYFRTPQAYGVMYSILTDIPSPIEIINSTPIASKISNSILSILTSRFGSMTEVEKVCTVAVGAINLRRYVSRNIKTGIITGYQDIDGIQSNVPATRAIVLMVQGMIIDWEQPVGYALVSNETSKEDISKWVYKLLVVLEQMGLDIRALVSEIGMDFYNIVDCCVSPQQNNSHFFVNGKKVFYTCDVSYLFKSVLHHFMYNHIKFYDCTAKYEHVLEFYEQNNKFKFGLTPGLLKKHVKRKTFEKINASAASRVFNDNVVAGMSTFVELNLLGKEATETASFINTMSKAYNYFFPNTNKHDDDLSNINENQNSIEMLTFFKCVVSINLRTGEEATEPCNFSKAFITILSSIEDIFNDSQLRHINPGILNLKKLEKFFSKFKMKNSTSPNPTVRQFSLKFKKIFASYIIKLGNSENSDSFENMMEIIKNFENENKDGINKVVDSTAG